MLKSFTIEEVKLYVEGFGYELLSNTYKGTGEKYTFACDNGHVYSTKYAHFRAGHRCPHCTNSLNQIAKRNSIDDARKLFKFAGFELLDDKYINAVTKLRYKCTCGNISEVSFNELSGRIKRCKNIGCAKCKGVNVSKSVIGKAGMIGDKNPHWNPNRTHDQRVKERKTDVYEKWRSAVFERDDYTCKVCSVRGGSIVAHHLKSYDVHEAERYNIDNGCTMCSSCHKKFHKKYGYGHNTTEQFDEFKSDALTSAGAFILL